MGLNALGYVEGQNVAIGYLRAGPYRSMSDARFRYGCFQRSCGRASVCAGPGEFDDITPPLGFVGDELAEFSG
jgi:hypothetical protein